MAFKNIASMYLDLIKAKQTLLLLFTAILSYLISFEFSEIIWLDLIIFSLSMFMAISGTTMLNMYVDHDIDKIMERTKCRPIPSGEISKEVVLINGIIVTVLGLILGFVFLDWLTALVIFLGAFFDYVIYSIWLKRKTRFSIIFGGIAGGLPSMAGRVLAVQRIDLISVLFLLFILTWIPIHILTLAMLPKNIKGYKEAGVPMWPIVRPLEETMRVIAGSAFLNMIILFLLACILDTNLLVRVIIAICCLIVIFLVIKNLIKPSEKLTFIIFKVASMFMVLGYLLTYIGVLVA
ncbi:protoheme IX farnesyltransferase [Promethearchaeum syntrophicum]|uniref:heme o synthase n=1 Tax=Promethearchaeum syntrophicum TaxID=2594042 RepID=A0A5B9DDS8_9ARCH|nr:protoheme IX farnesyltransferase [Candidatus Prometheoarchaeum syntrophicum]QEE17151.1 Digeranylgeranylglyceryl phosphate synthase [Candidatus Prometheoarchaeum syntrophicum]